MRHDEVIAIRTELIERGKVLVAAKQLLDRVGRQDVARLRLRLGLGRGLGVGVGR
jgi:hypothetical protein